MTDFNSHKHHIRSFFHDIGGAAETITVLGKSGTYPGNPEHLELAQQLLDQAQDIVENEFELLNLAAIVHKHLAAYLLERPKQ